MGMQYCNRTGCPLKLFVIQAEAAHRLPAALHHQRIEHALVRPGQRPEFSRQSKGQQKIRAGHLLLELALQPLLALVVLAVWTVAMATGMRYEEPRVRRHQWFYHSSLEASEPGGGVCTGCRIGFVRWIP
jgi:hypothetical protein